MSDYTKNESVLAAILARLTAGRPDPAAELDALLAMVSDYDREDVARAIARYGLTTDLAALCEFGQADAPLDLLSADMILTTEWPDPVWAVPGLLPVGLAILAGAPKVGKSWLALQIAQAVAAGGYIFNQLVERGPVLYLALEDPPRRLQERMLKQKWPNGLDADFLTVGGFQDHIGDLRNGGGEKLARQIERRGYRFVAIDTFSRAISGDQNDVAEMTAWLTPIQEIAHSRNCSFTLVDHHRKIGGAYQNAIADILGSTAKGAMADTALGLYRESGKAGAKLVVTGREVEERNFNLKFDGITGCWQIDNTVEELTDQQAELLDVLESIGPAGVQDVADAVKRNKGTVYQQLSDLEGKGKVMRGEGRKWQIIE